MRNDDTVHPFMRKLLLVELFVCFGPIVMLFAVALLLAPFQIYGLLSNLSGPHTFSSLLALLWLLFCGICGSLALWRTTQWLYGGSGEIRQPIFVCCGIVLGLIPLADMATSRSLGWALLAALPLLATVHVIVLCRSSLFRWARRL